MSKIKLDQLLVFIAEGLDISVDKLSIDSSSQNIGEWDSLGHLSILSSLDKNISGDIAQLSELGKAESVKSIMEIFNSNGYMD